MRTTSDAETYFLINSFPKKKHLNILYYHHMTYTNIAGCTILYMIANGFGIAVVGGVQEAVAIDGSWDASQRHAHTHDMRHESVFSAAADR